ncbi:MAG: hypothetical protein WC248_04590 [Candidatus Methanomethylophilaceae archaeon]|jgi:hypothetical protein
MNKEKLEKAREHMLDVRGILNRKTVAGAEDYIFMQGAYWKEMRIKIETTLVILESMLEGVEVNAKG